MKRSLGVVIALGNAQWSACALTHPPLNLSRDQDLVFKFFFFFLNSLLGFESLTME